MRSLGGLPYSGLGGHLLPPVPSSHLEAVTSLDPKDYVYGQPSPAQQQAALQKLQAGGAFSSMPFLTPGATEPFNTDIYHLGTTSDNMLGKKMPHLA
jgi:hypothetical protein